MNGVYRVTVDAATDLDAMDIAERRAREDGWRVLTIDTCKRDALGRWAVALRVVRA